MKKYEVKDLRNIALAGHGSVGKTSLNEAILFDVKATNRLGKITEGNTVSDYHAEEIERGISIYATCSFAEWKQARINIIDTPGYADFIGEVIGSLKAVETVVIVTDAAGKLEIGTRRAWDLAEQEKLARVIFVNKMDKQETHFEELYQTLKEKLSVGVVPVTIPIGKGDNFKGVVDLLKMKAIIYTGNDYKEEAIPSDMEAKAKEVREQLLETIASVEDALTEKYLEGGQLTEDEIKKGLKKGIKEHTIVPVFCGSSVKNIGIQPLLDSIAEYAPSPADLERVTVTDTAGNNPRILKADPNAPFAALVFKIMNEPHMGDFTFFRVYSGKLNAGSDVQNVTKRTTERIAQISLMTGKNRTDIPEAIAGDIVAVVKMKNTLTGDTLCDAKTQVVVEPIKFPISLIDMAVYAKSKAEAEKMGNAMASLVHEDPTLHFKISTETKEAIISGMGELQIEVAVSKVKKKFGMDIELRKPKIPYKEAIHGKAEVQGKYKRQSGGRGQYGDVWLRIEPLERGKGFEFVNGIHGGSIPRNYIPAVEKGVREAIEEGVLAGYQVIDVRVTLYDGSYHEVDSSDMAFKIAGSMAFRKGVQDAKPCLLEPIMDVDVFIPEEFMGSIMGDLNSRRGRVMGMERAGNLDVVKAQVPLGELYRYATDLRTFTHGWGSYKMAFSHYEETPPLVSQAIIEEYKKKKEAEEKEK
jgi:elongation factor G